MLKSIFRININYYNENHVKLSRVLNKIKIIWRNIDYISLKRKISFFFKFYYY